MSLTCTESNTFVYLDSCNWYYNLLTTPVVFWLQITIILIALHVSLLVINFKDQGYYRYNCLQYFLDIRYTSHTSFYKK